MDSEDGQNCDHGLSSDDFGGQGPGISAIDDTLSNSNTTLCVDPAKSTLKPPKVVRARDRKFHKRFKNLPESEKVLKVYHCAYVGDILLQGYLYVTTDTFCFYSKILGRERQIEIPISEVVDVTREKTAFFIPNAIGIHTTDNSKYVFGSLVSRNRTYRLMSSIWKRVMAIEEDYDGVSGSIGCGGGDSSCVLTYKRDASPSSVEKTSSDESYFTDPEFLPQPPFLPPASASPSAAAAAGHHAPSTILGHHRQGSTATVVRASFPSAGLVQAPSAGCGPPSAAAAAAAGVVTRRTASLASVYRSAHDNQYSSTVIDKPSTAILCAVGKRKASKLTRILKLMSSITPIGWWTITCTLMTVFLTLYGFVVFWKMLHLQNDFVYHLYQLSLIENRRLQLNHRRLNISMTEQERGQYLKDFVTEYSLATDRLLVTAANLQSVLRANMELIIQICGFVTFLHAENNDSYCAGFNKVDCH